ncbi:MAG: hypothetical protein ACRBB0_01370 [Pelagimonas sp.]|uniref:hypothetical protein n=1 Tax=Pelagimonas sp. TaxID=2073170 RepID=UPI003D6AE3ED
MDKSAIKQGQRLSRAMGPLDADGGCAGDAVGPNWAESITVSQLRGPMGWYDVAVIKYRDKPTTIIPLHMCEDIILMEDDNG